ncbi:DNA-binding HxlR family transcriptional regulator [Chitinophaga terrae (ex Kim and Jung 2007)]|uniref:winged helix-turn-helix transcriptional regulator n=1 Tax=Chitinophaga terrae (ex Kim and Jung 2007) TaxID=408074 RepID=UPI002784C9E7|nr:helix-turn-helix domain-containing protein [Chitinophaga terrae (ex Kim and Jung 2007)]MDQ0110349.1 DNA-binding HxlR family transcriptional regulator [Chitinophaga terrae (ex Kim and Jung 2007)]
MKKEEKQLTDRCRKNIQAVMDTQDLLGGKWKISIVGALYYSGQVRFMELMRQLDGIAPKVLSKELKDMEANHLLTRTVTDTTPATVVYELTQQGKSLSKVVEAMREWGVVYRQSIMDGDS